MYIFSGYKYFRYKISTQRMFGRFSCSPRRFDICYVSMEKRLTTCGTSLIRLFYFISGKTRTIMAESVEIIKY